MISRLFTRSPGRARTYNNSVNSRGKQYTVDENSQ
nr:MAG TPA: hypothetical protein [Caudoviricetes sp.]